MTRWKATKSLSSDEEQLLEELWKSSERMEQLWDGTHTQALVQQSNFEDLLTRYPGA